MSEIQKDLESLQSKNYFEILDATIDTPQNVISRTRRRLLSKYHPDRHTGEAKGIATKISSLINTAYDALTDEAFKKKYINSGYKLRYGVSDSTPQKVNKTVTRTLRGKNLFTVLSLTGKQLFEGGKHNIIVQETGETHSIELPPNMQNNSHIVLKGLGEKIDSGSNGDLIVVISRTDSNGVPFSLTDGQSIIPVIKIQDLSQVSFYGSENLKQGEGLLFVKQSDISSEGLIVDYS